MQDDALGRIKQLIDKSDKKRTALMDRALKHQSVGKHLHLTAAVVALLSGAGMIAILADLAPWFSAKVVSTLLAFSAGILNLVSTIYFDSKETGRMFKGASLFQAIMQRAETVLVSPELKASTIFDAFKKLGNEYQAISAEYDPLTNLSATERRMLSVDIQDRAQGGGTTRSYISGGTPAI